MRFPQSKKGRTMFGISVVIVGVGIGLLDWFVTTTASNNIAH